MNNYHPPLGLNGVATNQEFVRDNHRQTPRAMPL
jgi:hypothetical protein